LLPCPTTPRAGEPTWSSALLQVKHSGVHCLPLLKGRPQRAMQSVLQVELPPPRDDMGEQVAVESGVFFQEGFQIQRSLGGNELVQAHLVRGDGRPLLLDVTMIWVRAYVSDALENHCDTLIKFLQATPRCVVTIWHMPEPAAPQLSEDAQRIAQGYTFDEPAIELGVLMENEAAVPSALVP